MAFIYENLYKVRSNIGNKQYKNNK